MYPSNANSVTPTNISPNVTSIAYEKLLPVLVQCFAVIFLGYLSGRFGIMTTTESKGLSIFIRYFSLPSLIFNTLVKINFGNVNWKFLACIFLAKVAVFITVIIVTLILTKPRNLGKAGLYAIFSTQSNDFALGYPLLSSLYSQWHPEYSHYLYLIAPMQLIALNPFAYILMEVQQYRERIQNRIDKGESCWLRVYFGLISNPIVVMTFLGVLGNVLFHHRLPIVISKLLEVLGDSFPACALFLLGHNIVGKFNLLKGSTLIVPALLILAKILILPLLIRELVSQLTVGTVEEIKDLSNFGFLYGTFPTAPTVFIFATQYNMPTEVIAPGMVACTVLSAPLMFVSASMTTLSVSNLSQFRSDLINTLTYSSIIGCFCSLWVIVVFIIGKKWKFVIHKVTFLLFLSQLFVSLGGILWSFVDLKQPWAFYIHYALSVGGIFSARIWTSLLSVLLAVLHWRSLCFVIRIYKYIICCGFAISASVVTILAIRMKSFIPNRENTDPSFQFGEAQASVAFIIILLSFVITVISLIIQQHYSAKHSTYQALNVDDEFSETEVQLLPIIESPLNDNMNLDTELVQSQSNNVDVEDLITQENVANASFLPAICNYSLLCGSRFHCSLQQRKKCSALMKQHAVIKRKIDSETDLIQQENDADQTLRCVVLLLLLCISMIVGLAICLWKLFMETTTGIYVELEFLDVLLNYGQGIFSFSVFGLDNEIIISPCMWLWNYIRKDSTVSIAQIGISTVQTRQICEQFDTYHRDKCHLELVSDRQIGSQLYRSVFTGRELIDWLLAVGLAKDRREAENYGQQLLLGGIIGHVKEKHFFHDSVHFYVFLPKNECREDNEVHSFSI